jgi:hypothetical protein
MATNAAAAAVAEPARFRIRELSVGGVLDDALLIVRERFGTLLTISLAIMGPPLAVAMYFGLGPVQELGESIGNQALLRPEDLVELFRHIGAVTVPLMAIAYRIAEPLAIGALVYIAAGTMMGKRPTAWEAVRRSVRRAIPLIIMWFLRWVCIQIGTVACYVPGILLAGLFSAAMPAIILERKGPLAAMGRSIELNKQRMLPSMGLILLLGLIESMMAQLGQLLPTILLQAAAVAVLYSCTLTLYACGVTVFYFSGRCKMENYDLQLLAEQVASAPVEEEAEEQGTLFSPGPV